MNRRTIYKLRGFFFFFAMKIIGTETKIGDSKAWMDLLSLSHFPI